MSAADAEWPESPVVSRDEAPPELAPLEGLNGAATPLRAAIARARSARSVNGDRKEAISAERDRNAEQAADAGADPHQWEKMLGERKSLLISQRSRSCTPARPRTIDCIQQQQQKLDCSLEAREQELQAGARFLAGPDASSSATEATVTARQGQHIADVRASSLTAHSHELELQAVLDTVVEQENQLVMQRQQLEEEKNARAELQAKLAAAKKHTSTLEKTNQFLVGSRCECIPLRVARWASAAQAGSGSDAVDFHSTLASQLTRSLHARESALETGACLRCDLAVCTERLGDYDGWVRR